MGWPPDRLGAGRAQSPFPKLVDHAGVLGCRNESIRPDPTHGGVVPAQQSLCATRLTCREVDNRLVVQLELPLAQGAAQIALKGKSCVGFLFESAFEKAPLIAACRFSPVEGEVGVLH